MAYVITKVTRYFRYGAEVTSETVIKTDATFEDVLALAKKQDADIDEVMEELEDYGTTISSIRGYYVEQR